MTWPEPGIWTSGFGWNLYLGWGAILLLWSHKMVSLPTTETHYGYHADIVLGG